MLPNSEQIHTYIHRLECGCMRQIRAPNEIASWLMPKGSSARHYCKNHIGLDWSETCKEVIKNPNLITKTYSNEKQYMGGEDDQFPI